MLRSACGGMHSSSSPVSCSGSRTAATSAHKQCGLSDPEQETSSESFAEELLRGFRVFLMGLPALAPLSAKMEAAAKLPQRAILAALRTMTCTITLTILVDEPPEGAADELVHSLVKDYGINKNELSPEDILKCAKWLICIASYFADQEFA
jgi:hypothetical protein